MAPTMRKNKTDVFSLEPEYPTEPEKKFYHIEFDRETKRDVNPYKLKTIIENECKEKVEKLTTDSQNGFSFQIKITESTEKLTQITEIDDVNCKISRHKYLNKIQGLVYIYDYEFNDQFRNDLIYEYPFIHHAIHAKFVKPRNQKATALPITFNLDTLPYSLYIPGERADSVVYPFHDRPMICHNCYKYGHTKTRCSQAQVCRKCGRTDHSIDKCENNPKCPNCDGDHIAGSRECEAEKKRERSKKFKQKKK